MTFINILLGLIGLGIVVFFHELGHFLAARLVGINVDAFSIGWGSPILKKKIGMTEYRIGMFPIGGYCKMQGDSDHNNEAYENVQKGIVPQKGSYLAASPQARILVSFAGPFFNILFAIILLSVLWGIGGIQFPASDNRIILHSEITNEIYPADTAGLKTGDRIIKIRNKEITYFHEIIDSIIFSSKKIIPITIERDGNIIHLEITPALEKSSGARRIGVLSWTDPVIGSILENSIAERAGLLPGDRIISVNGKTVRNSHDFIIISILNTGELIVEYERDNNRDFVSFSVQGMENEIVSLWENKYYHTPKLSIPAAIVKGIQDGYITTIRYISGLRLLFMGIDLTQAVSGPIRITYMMGETATHSFGIGVGTGIRSILNFLALISIALGVMNLLPLPIIDGGMIILFLVEMIRRKPAHPKFISVFQTCGFIIIFGLIILALFGDIMFFIRR